jgi:hypothetical protein
MNVSLPECILSMSSLKEYLEKLVKLFSFDVIVMLMVK